MLGKQSKHVEERRRGKFSNRDLKLRAAAIVAPPLRHAGVPRRIHMSDSPAAPLGLSTYASLLCFHFVVVAWQICCIYHECSGMLKCEKDENLMECDVVSVNHEIDQCSFRQLERRGLFTTLVKEGQAERN